MGKTASFRASASTATSMAVLNCGPGETMMRSSSITPPILDDGKAAARQLFLLFLPGSGAGKNPAGKVLGVAGVSVIDGVEHELDPGRDSEFFEDAEEIFLDGVLAEIQL